MLVKDLRQGMRSRYFVFVFLGLQIVMFFVLSGQLSALDQGSFNPAASSGLFWSMIGIAVLVLFPISGFSAVANERKAETLELLQLTGLTSRAIIRGKWQSVASQILLLMISVFPWAVLRYLLGGIELWEELQILGLLTCFGLALSAIAVGLSTTISPALRIVVVVGGYLGLQLVGTLGGVFFATGGWGRGAGLSGEPAFWDYVLTVGLVFITAMLVMEHGASRIAPRVESYAGSVRILGWLAFVPFALGLVFERAIALPLFVAACLILLAVCIASILEPVRETRESYRSFARRKPLGLWLYPGWPYGVNYVLLSFVLVTGLAAILDRSLERWITGAILLLGSLFLPLVLALWLTRNHPSKWSFVSIYVIVHLLCFLLSLSVTIMIPFKPVLQIALSPLLPTTFLQFITFQLPDDALPLVTIVASVVTLFSLISLFFLARPIVKKTKAFEEELGAAVSADQ